MTTSLTITCPDDWHLHLRDGDMLKNVIGYSARQFGRAIIMPNLAPPITRIEQVMAYKAEIDAAIKDLNAPTFTPLMTCYLTDDCDIDMLAEGFHQGHWVAAKLYPSHATTNSAFGISDPLKIHHIYDKMSDIGMPLLIHGEVTHADIDIFDREKIFIEDILTKIIAFHPNLKIILEHITTEDAVNFIATTPHPHLAATITPHHLMINRSDMFQGGIRPHLYCLPIAKREKHRRALIKAAVSGSNRFFAGTDSAPHTKKSKESACGCAGIFNAPIAVECYTHIFDSMQALDKLEYFLSHAGADFYGLGRNQSRMKITRTSSKVPCDIALQGDDEIIPFQAGVDVGWHAQRII